MSKYLLSGILLVCMFLAIGAGRGASHAANADSLEKIGGGEVVHPLSGRTHPETWNSPNLPLDSWVYPALDKLQGLGLIASGLQGSRPYTRMEAARQTLEARHALQRASHLPVAEELIEKLNVELHQQLVELQALLGRPVGSYFKPLGNWSISYLDRDGHDSTYAPGSPAASIEARQDSLNYNNFGIDYGEGANGQLVFDSEARLGKRLMLHLRPLLIYSDDTGEGGDDTNIRLLHGTLAFSFGPLEFSLGRQSLWWGPGRHGALVLTNNAEPLDMVRLTNPHPVLLPWFFKYLGPFRFDLFLSRLEKDRVVPEPYFGGLRVEFKPHLWLTLGGSRAVLFGGEGRPGIGLSDFLTIVGGENLVGTEDTSNSVAALDLRLKFPFLWNMEIYGEIGGEDQSDGVVPFISNRAYLVGVFLPQVEPTGRASLRAEYADLSHIDDNSTIWYRHGIYRSGYTHQNKIMGHHAGGGSEDLFVELEILFPYDLTLKMGYDYERRGADQLVEELHHQSSLGLRWAFHEKIFLAVDWRHDSVENFEYISGQDEDFYLTELALGGRF